MSLIQSSKIVSKIVIHYLAGDNNRICGLSLFDSKGIQLLEIGNVNPRKSDPKSCEIILKKGERIVGVQYLKPTGSYWYLPVSGALGDF